MKNTLIKCLKNNDRDTFTDLLDKHIAVKLPNQPIYFNKDSVDKALLSELFINIEFVKPYLDYIILKTDKAFYKIKYDQTIKSIYGEHLKETTRYRFDLCYNGHDYSGMQRQSNDTTIQGTIEKTLEALLKTSVPIFPASRTDALVHANHQVFHADINLPFTIDKLKTLLNKYLPNTIVINKITIVPQVFHARYDATDKTYIYKLHHTLDPFKATTSIFTPIKDLTQLNDRLALFIGKHDFRHFCKHTETDLTQRTIKKAIAYNIGDDTIIEITGDGFLRYMVRMIVGYTLKHLHTDIETFKKPLINLQETYPKYKADPVGLYLNQINYKKSD